MGKYLHIDHLVYATPDLQEAVAEIESRVGVAPTPGGAHLGLGTFNALLGLGNRTYLEIIGPDPAQPDPEGPRPFGIDTLETSRLMAWCAAPHRPLDEVAAAARAAGFEPGDVRGMTRQRPDGVILEWTLTEPPADGVLPFFIDWGRTVHPSESLPVGGTLVALDLFHPQPRTIDLMLSAVSDEAALGDEESKISLNFADRPGLAAEILTANGTMILS
ncbi:MAG: VOC family protein [Actinomycetota bacterium]